jgi:hypothetical protein
VQFAAIGSSEEYIDVNTEDMKKQRSIAPVDTVSKDIPLSSTRQTTERITYDQLVLESQQLEIDSRDNQSSQPQVPLQEKSDKITDIVVDLQLNKKKKNHNKQSAQSKQRNKQKRQEKRK